LQLTHAKKQKGSPQESTPTENFTFSNELCQRKRGKAKKVKQRARKNFPLPIATEKDEIPSRNQSWLEGRRSAFPENEDTERKEEAARQKIERTQNERRKPASGATARGLERTWKEES